MLTARIARIAVITLAIFLGQLTPIADAQTSNVTITVHVTTPKVYHVPVSPGTTVEKAMQLAKMQYNATWYPSVGGYAAMILEGTPPTTTGSFGSPFWWLCINDLSASAGMSAQQVSNGDNVDWYYVTDGKCPKDAGAKPH